MASKELRAQQKNRLLRIEGQIKGIINMMDEGKQCGEILMQLAAAESALNSLSRSIIKSHLTHCVVSAVEENRPEAIEEFAEILDTYIK